MNTADRSLGQIDYALRRRFAFYNLQADEKTLEEFYNGKETELKESALKLFKDIKGFLNKENMVNEDIDKDDIMIGHSYFMAKNREELDFKKKYEIQSLLEEYRKDVIISASKSDIADLFR